MAIAAKCVAGIVSINSIQSNRELSLYEREKHLSDYRKGKGYLSAHTSSKIKQLNFENSSAQLGMDPRSMRMYGGVYSALAYQERARFVDGVNDGLELTQRLASGKTLALA